MDRPNLKPSGTGAGWLFKMAWRDGRSGLHKLALFMSSIVLGIAALVALQSFGDTLTTNISSQSKELMGADYLVDSDQWPTDRAMEIIDSLPGDKAKEIAFASMASFPGKDGSKLVRVRGIEGDFPFYGGLVTDPAEASEDYQIEEQALVDATLMLQYGLEPGDTIKLGERNFEIGGELMEAPGNTNISTSVAPAVWIPFSTVESTKLIQPGSRQEYNFYYKVSDTVELQPIYEIADPMLDDENADMDLHTDTSDRLGRRFQNVGKFLNLVAFIALLLGCLGIASSVQIYMQEKKSTLAILKCLGATRKQTFLIFLIQMGVIGFLGGLIGAVLGLMLQAVFPLLISDFLPVEIDYVWSVWPLISGVLLGIIMAVLFGLLPLLNSWFVAPLAALRVNEDTEKASRGVRILLYALIVFFIWIFAFSVLNRFDTATGFVLVLLISFSLISLVAWGIMRFIRKNFPHSWGFEARQSLLNLYRPNNQTLVLLLAIGIGTFLISTLYFTQDMLLAKASLDDAGNSANLILLDVQSEQEEEVINTLKPRGIPVRENIPIVTMRIEKIKDRPVDEIRADSTSTINQWILNHEFRVTYRDSLIASETLVEGDWVSAFDPSTGSVPISLADNVARDAQVTLGDTLIFNVQGVRMSTIVKNIRQVDWGRMQLNFSMVFPTGVLEKAPQFRVLTTYVEDKSTTAALQQELVRKFPNISVLDLRQILVLIQDILDKIAWVIRFMAFFSILTGFVVLIGAVRTSKYQRIKESVLFRTLGAKGRQVLKINAMEYVFLGVLGSTLGVLLALLASILLANWVFDLVFVPSWVPFVIVIPLISFAVLGIGVWNSRGVLRTPPLAVLRKEAG